MNYIKKHIILLLFIALSFSQAWATTTLKKVKYNYLLHLPQDYGKDPNKKWPVIFYLHGRHASGKNLESLERYGLPYYLLKGKKVDFVVVSPQCPWNRNWSSDDWFNPVYDELSAKLQLDNDRVYLIGMSMGGFGTWWMLANSRDTWAAAIPICGGGSGKAAMNFKDVPIRIFHGAADDVVPPRSSELMALALKEVGGKAELTIYPGVGHDSWTRTYRDPEVIKWLFAQRKPD